MIMKVRTGIGI